MNAIESPLARVTSQYIPVCKGLRYVTPFGRCYKGKVNLYNVFTWSMFICLLLCPF